MFLASILHGFMRAISALEAANRRKAEREIARHAQRTRGGQTASATWMPTCLTVGACLRQSMS